MIVNHHLKKPHSIQNNSFRNTGNIFFFVIVKNRKNHYHVFDIYQNGTLYWNGAKKLVVSLTIKCIHRH